MTTPKPIVWDDREAQQLFREMIRRGDDLSPMMAQISDLLIETTQERFSQGVAPDGTSWAPVKRGGKPLLLTGTMRDQIAGSSGPDFAEVFSDRKQARWHQEGTNPYRILPKQKKALNIPGVGPRKAVNHPGLVARPFLGVSDRDAEKIRGLAAIYLRGD